MCMDFLRFYVHVLPPVFPGPVPHTRHHRPKSVLQQDCSRWLLARTSSSLLSLNMRWSALPDFFHRQM